MPLVTETDQPRERKRGSRAAWLLLFLPVLGLALLLATAIQPLELGPYVAATTVAHMPGRGWKFEHVRVPMPAGTTSPFRPHGRRSYVITGEAHVFVLWLGDYGPALIWFRGHRKP